LISPLLSSHDVEYSDDTCNIHTPIPTTKKIKSLLQKEKEKKVPHLRGWKSQPFWSPYSGPRTRYWPPTNLVERGLYSKRNIELNNKALGFSKLLKKSRRERPD